MAASRRQGLVHTLHERAATDVAGWHDPWAGEDERWALEDVLEDLTRPEEEDLLAPARAVLVGLVLVSPLWLVLGGAAYAIYRALS